MRKNLETQALIGVDLGGTNVRAGLVREGRIETSHARRINSQGTLEEVFEEIAAVIDSAASSPVAAIGVGVPSVVDVEKGIVYDTLNIPSWTEVPIKSLLEDRFHVPAYVNNDANCFVLGEKFFGKAKGFKNVVGIVVGTGLGAGIIRNGQLCCGSHCGAGEFGVMPFRDGIVENYVSGQFFQRFYHSSGEVFTDRAKAGDSEALIAFREFGAIFGEIIQIVMYSVDPEMIVLGGSGSKSFEFYQESLRDSLRNFLYPRSARDLRIEVSEIEQGAILGAAALCLEGT
jgi:glucokinase